MKSLIYMSVVETTAKLEDIVRMVAISRENNRRDGVTGFLVFNGVNFLQLIEGEDTAINACMSRIRVNDLHYGIIEMRNNGIAEREFPKWSLLFTSLSSDEEDETAKLGQTAKEETMRILRNFLAISKDKPSFI